MEFLGVGEDAVRRNLEKAREFLYMLRHMGRFEEGAHLTRELIDVHEEAVPGTVLDVTRAVVLVKDANQPALGAPC